MSKTSSREGLPFPESPEVAEAARLANNAMYIAMLELVRLVTQERSPTAAKLLVGRTRDACVEIEQQLLAEIAGLEPKMMLSLQEHTALWPTTHFAYSVLVKGEKGISNRQKLLNRTGIGLGLNLKSKARLRTPRTKVAFDLWAFVQDALNGHKKNLPEALLTSISQLGPISKTKANLDQWLAVACEILQFRLGNRWADQFIKPGGRCEKLFLLEHLENRAKKGKVDCNYPFRMNEVKKVIREGFKSIAVDSVAESP